MYELDNDWGSDDEEERIYCDSCGEEIHPGDAYYEISNEKLCPECMRDGYRRLA